MNENTLDEITFSFTSLEFRPSRMELKCSVSCNILVLLVSSVIDPGRIYGQRTNLMALYSGG